MSARPAIVVEHARLPAGHGGRLWLQGLLAAATPAATGVPAGAHLVIERLRLALPAGAPLPAQAAQLVSLLRQARAAARRGGSGCGDLYLENDAEADRALVAAWLAGQRIDPLLAAVLPDGSAPHTRWRRHILPQPPLAARRIAALADAGQAAWLDQFTPTELAAARAGLLAWHGAPCAPPEKGKRQPARQMTVSAPLATLPALAAQAIAAAQAHAISPAAQALLAASLVAATRPDLLAAPAVAGWLARPRATAATPAAPLPAEPPPPFRNMLGPRATHVAALPAVAPAAASPVAAGGARRRPSRAGGHLPGAALPASALASPADAQRIAADVPNALHVNSFASDHAGLLFLVNALIAMGLYGDFSAPARRLAGLSPLALIDWLGGHWRGRHYRCDPLHAWLRRAAALEPGEAASRRFRPPPVLPDGQPAPSGSGAAWLRALAPLLHARLASATGCADPLALLLAQPGRISADARAVDVRFAAAGHPLPLRIAGLDRDPGWLPAAGLAIRFHFAC